MGATAIEMVIPPRAKHRSRHGAAGVALPAPTHGGGPFIFADIFGPDDYAAGTGSDIDAHPHLGLSTLSYLFAGELFHRDSTGAVSDIAPGDVNWMTAGSGVCHTERTPAEVRRAAHTWPACRPGWHCRSKMNAVPPRSTMPTPPTSPPPRTRAHHRRRRRLRVGMHCRSAGRRPCSRPRFFDDMAVTIPTDHRERALIAISGTCPSPGNASRPPTRPCWRPARRSNSTGRDAP